MVAILGPRNPGARGDYSRKEGATVMRTTHLGLPSVLLISALSSSAWANLVVNGNFSGGNEAICHGDVYNGSTACPGWKFALAPCRALTF